MDLKELELVDPSSHWYYQSKLVALRRALVRHSTGPRKFIDVGAGSGFFSIDLADFGAGETVICVDPNYAKESVERDGALRFARAVNSADTDDADVYLFIDVLEHVSDDVALLERYTRSAAPGALVMMTVPAFMSMWSAHDTYLEHYRRYRLSDLANTVSAAGLEIIHRQYLFGVIFPPAWLLRRMRRNKSAATDLRPASPPVNGILKAILTTEHRFGRNRMAGLSAFIVARVLASEGAK